MAGCYDLTSRVGSKARGTRSQFRLNTQSLTPFKCTYPVHLTDVMDIVQSSPPGHQTSSGELVSPSKGTRTRTVREYEQTISELKKENFDLKLRIFLLEEAINKGSRKDKDSNNQDNTVQVIVELKVETESLRNELSYKTQLLQDALDQAEKYAADLKEYQEKCAQLEEQLTVQSKLPSEQEFMLLQDEKENLLKETENLENLLQERNTKIQAANDKIKELIEKNKALEEKVKKSSVAIQGLVYKHYKEMEIIPKDIRPVVETAVQAAKDNDTQQLTLALKHFKASLCEMMSIPLKVLYEKPVKQESEQLSKESVKFGESSVSAKEHPSELPSKFNYIEELKELVPEKDVPVEKCLIDVAQNQTANETKLNKHLVTPEETDVTDLDGDLAALLKVSAEKEEPGDICNFVSSNLYQKATSNIESTTDIHVKSLPSEEISSRSLIEESPINLEKTSHNVDEKQSLLLQLSELWKENEFLKSDLKEKVSIIQNLTCDCTEFGKKIISLQKELEETQLRIKEFEAKALESKVVSPIICASTQTSAFESQLQEKLKDKTLITVSQTDNVNELKEEILMLMLAIEEKDKEMEVLEKSIANLQTRLESEMNMKEITSDVDYVNERDELRERLALTCSVNQELMKHLQNLEVFLEDLLNQRNLDTSSLENISETSNFMSRLSRCLDESLKLSQVLSDHLSLCEGSKLLESEDISFSRDDISISESKNYQHLGVSKLSLNTDSYSKSDEGRKPFLPYYQHFNKNAAGTGKRRWSYSTQHKYAVKDAVVEPDNVVVLGTSNNEDLILLLNENGDPADVLIRNNHTVFGENRIQNPEVLQTVNQPRRRCWEENSTVVNSVANDKINLNSFIENEHSAHTKSMKQNLNWYSHYISSDSDIWSEPDRDVSLQRIGIDVKSSPAALKSPRKYRYKDKKLTDEQSSEKNASSYNSYKVNSWSRRRRSSGSASKRLFNRESISKRDYKLEKHYSVLTEKFVKLSSFHNQLENTKELKAEPSILDDICDELNNVMGHISETMQKFISMKENVKNFSPIMCENCSVLELLQELKKAQRRLLGSDVSHSIQGTDADRLLQAFLIEIDNLEKQLKEPHAILSSGIESSEGENHLKVQEQVDNAISEKYELDMKRIVQELTDKNEMLEKELYEIKEILNAERGIFENLKAENLQLSDHVTQLKEELIDIEEKKKNLTLENSELAQRLTETSKENSSLKDLEKSLEEKVLHSNKLCDELKSELQETKKRLLEMDAKCLKYEDEISLHSKEKQQFLKKLQNVESEALTEKDKLLKVNEQLISQKSDIMSKLKSEEEKTSLLENKIKELNEQLISQKNDILSKLKSEEEKTKLLENKIKELNEQLIKNNEEISSLQVLNQQLENTKSSLAKEKEIAKADLLSSNSLCHELQSEIKQLQETLQKLKCHYSAYEKKLQSLLENNGIFIQNLLNIKNELALDPDMLNEKGKQLLKDDSNFSKYSEKLTVDEMLALDQEKYVGKLCDHILLKISLFKQIADTLRKQLKSVNCTLEELKSSEDNCKSKIAAVLKEMELYEHEIQHLKERNDYFQSVNDANLRTIKDQEKSLAQYNSEIESLNVQLSNYQYEVDKDKFQLNAKDDEITKLQERIFNLQTQMNTLLKRISSNSLRDDSASLENEPIKDVTNSLSVHDDSFSSVSSSSKEFQSMQSESVKESSMTSDETKVDVSLKAVPVQTNADVTERYIKKIRALQAKLLMSEKRNEILEKEKNDLRENVLAQVQNNKDVCNSFEERNNLSKKLLDLESKLEKKISFIKELKSELYKTCSSLVEKQEEVDKLRQELSEFVKEKLKSEIQPQIPFDLNVFSKILNFKKYKWELIQSIFSIQKKFYEKKGIHLNHFEKFKCRIENLYSRQFSMPLSKSESEPSLNSLKANNNFVSDNKTAQNILIGLEFDIECLENLKIFLKRFFLPFVLQKSLSSETRPDIDDSTCFIKNSLEADLENNVSPIKQVALNNEILRTRNFGHIDKSISKSMETLQIGTEDTAASKNRCEKISRNISHRIDTIENSLKSLEFELEYFKYLDSTTEDTHYKSTGKILLMKILQETKILKEKFNKLIHYNSSLKSIGAFKADALKSISKQDISDQESLLSDETITLSRSESLSPVSFEEICPLKIASDITIDEKEVKSDVHEESIKNHRDLIEPYSQKLETAGSSQDSVFHRSHYSSPDLGIESDPNHDSSAPEHMEKEDFCEEVKRLSNKYKDEVKITPKTVEKPQPKSKFTYVDDDGNLKDHLPLFAVGDNLHAIGILQDYELLKREVQESLVGIKSVLSRTGDGLHHIAKYTSPRKNLEYSTFKAIKDTCGNVEVCLKEAYKLVNKFWIAPCPTEEEWNELIQLNQDQYNKLVKLKSAMNKQECEFREALEKLQHAQLVKENMERKISKKLVKTKKIIRRAELKLLENKCQNLPSVPKYPVEETCCQRKKQ